VASRRVACNLLVLLFASSAWGAICDYPATSLTNGNPLYSYTLAISPVVAGSIKVEYLTSLTCTPYQTLLEPLTATIVVTALQGSPHYVRITVTADPSVQPPVQSSSTIVFLNPPNKPLVIGPAAPTGFKVT
jgi:hypothetical protein